MSTGTAILISFLAPASEALVDAPVKFIARNEETPERREDMSVDPNKSL